MSKNRRLIVFLVPPEKLVNGGILSIFSICRISREFENIHGAEVVVATYPGSPSYQKNDLFENDETIYSFDELMKRGVPEYLQLHVPEYASHDVFLKLHTYSSYLRSVKDLRVNIMNQNIWLMGKPLEIADWFSLTPNVTQTIAHHKYATQDMADLYALPTHLLSIYVDPSQYKSVPYEKKTNLIALSPDITDKRESIVADLKKKLPSYKVITIQNMKYEEYKEFIGKAKFTITFGEGFDNYFFESFFSGGVAFAVYNDKFFPDKGFSTYENVYADYDDMLRKIANDVVRLDKKAPYQKVVEQNFNKLSALYNFSRYTANVKNFYKGKFTYLPGIQSRACLIGELVVQRNQLMEAKDTIIRDRDQKIDSLGHQLGLKDNEIRSRDQQIQAMENSHSWRVTKPLRATGAIIKKVGD